MDDGHGGTAEKDMMEVVSPRTRNKDKTEQHYIE